MTAKMTTAPDDVHVSNSDTSIFMAGSIEMGKAEDWQTKLFKMTEHLPIHYLNPRRHEWDPTWEQCITNNEFVTQVEWELDNLMKADYQIFYFDPNTSSPITLMELGLAACSINVIAVCCPPGYFRKGNVDIVCRMYGIPVVETLEELAQSIKKVI